MALPAKISSIFPPRGAVAPQAAVAAVQSQPAPPQELQPPQPQPQPQQVAAVPTAPQVGGNCGIQIGAYSDAAIGKQALAALVASTPDVPANADQQVVPVSTGGTTMYRARLMSLDGKTAKNICAYLTQRGKSCLTIEP